MLFGVHLIAMSEGLDRRLDVIFNEISDLCADGLMFWRQSEINHVLPPFVGFNTGMSTQHQSRKFHLAPS